MGKRLGIAVFIALAAVVAANTSGAATPDTSCKLVSAAELPVRFEHNRPLIEAKINGKPALFLVDTGAANSLLASDKAESLGMHLTSQNSVRFYGVGGGQDAFNAVAHDVELAGVNVKDFRFFAIPSQFGDGAVGLLGRDFFFGNWNLELDLANHKLHLWWARGCGDQSLAYWTQQPSVAPLRNDGQGGPFLVSLTINGKPLLAMLDSGAETTVITTDAAKQVGLSKAEKVGPIDFARGTGSKLVSTQIAIFDTVDIGGEQITHAKLEVADLFANNTEEHTGSRLPKHVDVTLTEEPSMLLGADFLRSHRVLLSFSQHRMYFTYNGGPIFQVVGDPAKAPGLAAPVPTSGGK